MFGYDREAGTPEIKETINKLGCICLEPSAPIADLDVVVLHPNLLSRVHEIPNFLEMKLDPSILFVKGIEFLHQCCKWKSLLNPFSLKMGLFPSGGIIYLLKDAILSVDRVVESLWTILNVEAKTEEWIIKIHPETVKGLEELAQLSTRAKAASVAIKKYMGNRIELISEDEEPKSKNVEMISSDIRCALKLSFVHSARFRHVILFTASKEIQSSCKQYQQLFFDNMESVTQFFRKA
eukprot:TRINITY_DN5002_c0_g1_i1.p1 TRINITY_DN5002_c0_g1~~TRINITY_DN5002_c0_g1_i1.p1  ORF type:complete len:237 (+),score=59.98 TRINITY_DN5002_c0_g1_i1:114-824(+)